MSSVVNRTDLSVRLKLFGKRRNQGGIFNNFLARLNRADVFKDFIRNNILRGNTYISILTQNLRKIQEGTSNVFICSNSPNLYL